MSPASGAPPCSGLEKRREPLPSAMRAPDEQQRPCRTRTTSSSVCHVAHRQSLSIWSWPASLAGTSSVVATLSLLACACIGVTDSGGNERLSPPDAAVALKPSCPDGPPASDTPLRLVRCGVRVRPRPPARVPGPGDLAPPSAAAGACGASNRPVARRCPRPSAPPASTPPREYLSGARDVLWLRGSRLRLRQLPGDGFTVKCDGPGTWRCDRPNIEPGCPAGAPRLGSPCAPDGHQCNYDCGPDGTRLCLSGLWQPRHGGGCLIP